MRWRPYFLIIVGGLALGCGGGGGGNGGGTIHGSITGSDWLLADGSYADRYVFRANSSGTVVVDMDSSELDTYLLALDGGQNVIAFDDDSGPGLNAEMIFEVSSGETFEVRCTTYGSGAHFGSYSLSFTSNLRCTGQLYASGAHQPMSPLPATGKVPKH